jgi:hypothetical protein
VTQSCQPSPLAPLYGKFPGWECWVGVGGILYARRRRASPAVVFRAATADELAAKITEWEAGR